MQTVKVIKTIIVYPHLGIKEEVEEEVFVTVEEPTENNFIDKNKSDENILLTQ